MITKKHLLLVALGSIVLLGSCGETTKKDTPERTVVATGQTAPEYNSQDPKSMLNAVAYAQGGWNDLYDKKDVQYTYSYKMGDGKEDISTERYIFHSEASYGKYSKNEVNAMPGTEGEVVQYYDGKKAVAMVDGNVIEDPAATGGADFLRRANHFWFVMPYKLSDKGNIFKSLGQEGYNGVMYDKVEVTYDPAVTGKAQNDTYILYINPDTKLIDRFFFSLPAMGMNVPAIAANYSYEDIDGQMIATKRAYFMPNATGGYDEVPSIEQTLTNIKFNNGFTPENITK
ncbi:hypothetical protein EAX61_04685 [Dokdonia sinensis]|uniref:Lipoprotein n=1 Tax=Dokdonia sinensis TaxID=2479847 RepID=A0A3M0GEF6_9FLAO|nr:DUF6503 family protein [Dokdonia sinensis]RMB62877.1 hypothetical protein EAX61_04685 [Dokdonia sinensis]